MPWNPSPKNKKSASSQIGLQVCVLPSSKTLSQMNANAFFESKPKD